MSSKSEVPPETPRRVTLADVQEAATTLGHDIVKTQCSLSRTLSDITGANVVLKFENHQFTASFKERGALVKLHRLLAVSRPRGVAAMSAGNHAQGLAYHAGRLDLRSLIVMPRTTPNTKVERTRVLGAEVVIEGASVEEARVAMEALAAERGFTVVHPFDDPDVIAGQGTVALEMLESFPDLDALIVPIGGGGLIAGMAVAAKGLKPDIEILGVEAERFPSMRHALAGEPVECGSATIAEGIAVKEPGRLTLPIVRELVSDVVLASESALEEAVLMLLEIEKTVVEGAAAAGLAALLEHRERFRGRTVGLVLTGGNIDLMPLSSILQRGLVRTGRLVRLVLGVPDQPGALADVTRVLGEANANIIEIRHQRAFTNLSLRTSEVEIVLHTLGRDHLHRIVNTLALAGYKATLPDSEISSGRLTD